MQAKCDTMKGHVILPAQTLLGSVDSCSLLFTVCCCLFTVLVRPTDAHRRLLFLCVSTQYCTGSNSFVHLTQ